MAGWHTVEMNSHHIQLFVEFWVNAEKIITCLQLKLLMVLMNPFYYLFSSKPLAKSIVTKAQRILHNSAGISRKFFPSAEQMDSGSQSSLSQSELTMTIDTGEDTTQYEMEEESERELIQIENFLYDNLYVLFYASILFLKITCIIFLFPFLSKFLTLTEHWHIEI